MKSTFTNIIMSIIIFLIICVIGVFGFIFFEEFKKIQTVIEPELFQTIISNKSNTIENDIESPKIIENELNNIENINNNKNVDDTNIKLNKYFYNQLEKPAKMIYNAFEANQENLKTGNYKIEFGDSFSSILQKENGQEKLEDYYQEAFEAFNYDKPEVFYINAEKMYLNVETTTKITGKSYNVYINNGNQENYFIDEFSSKEEIETAISQIEEVKNDIISKRTGNTYKDVKMVHDYLVNNLEYDTTISKENIYDIYGALVKKVAVCEGYARAFKHVMDEMEIPCILVIGKATNSQGQTENHAWNYIQVDGNWYAIDTTWDDPVVSGGGRVSNKSKYKYFLKGSNSFNEDHISSGQFTEGGKVFEYPVISVQDY